MDTTFSKLAFCYSNTPSKNTLTVHTRTVVMQFHTSHLPKMQKLALCTAWLAQVGYRKQYKRNHKVCSPITAILQSCEIPIKIGKKLNFLPDSISPPETVVVLFESRNMKRIMPRYATGSEPESVHCMNSRWLVSWHFLQKKKKKFRFLFCKGKLSDS